MGGRHERRKHYLEHSPESGEDDGSKRVQTFGVNQDPSTQQYHHAYQNPFQQAAQQATEYPGYYPEEYPGEYRDEYPEEYLIDNPTEGSIAQSIEDPNRYLYPFSDTHQEQGNYPTVGTSPVTEAFRSLGLTSWDALPGHSQPNATAQTAGVGIGDYERPPFPHPDSNPYGQVALNITGFERQGHEPPYSMADEWWLRMSVSHGYELNAIAQMLKRTTASVSNFVESQDLAGTQRHNDQLGAMRVGEHSDGSHVKGATQHSTVAETSQPSSQRYQTGLRWPEAEPPQGREEVTGRTTPPLETGKGWGEDELQRLVEWEARYGCKWEGVEIEFPGRTRRACQAKWAKLRRAGKIEALRSQEPKLNQPSLGNESGERYQGRNEIENLTYEDLDFIKLRLAQGATTKTTCVERYRGFRERTIIKFLYIVGGWLPWTTKEDETLPRMQNPERDRRSEINIEPDGPLRSKEEIMARLEYLRQVRNRELRPLMRAPNYTFDADDDRYIMLGVAREMGWEEMRTEEFPDLHRKRIQDRASRIHAMWNANDDQRLLAESPGSGWASIGRKYTPPRDAAVVQARWDYLHSEEYAEISRRSRSTIHGWTKRRGMEK